VYQSLGTLFCLKTIARHFPLACFKVHNIAEIWCAVNSVLARCDLCLQTESKHFHQLL
jgi:hypothetical protein